MVRVRGRVRLALTRANLNPRAYFALESSFHLESAVHLLRILLLRGAAREGIMLLL